MTIGVIFPLIGGVGLFFFGMQMMSEGLKKIAGDRLKNILHMVTKLPIIGMLVGVTVTCLIQSSSATTVMVVGFVNAGLLVLKQAISVIIGANVGTTFTAWLVSSMSVFKVTQYALPLVGIGFAVQTFGRTKKARFWGQVLMGFGLLFVGLGFMQDAFAPLKESQAVKEMFIALGDNPMLGVLIGMGVTMLIQSSSATIAIVQVMAFNGLISFPAAIAVMLGGDIGTTITAQLAAIGTNLEARRAAMSHTLFNVISVAVALIFVFNGWFVRIVGLILPGAITTKNIMFHIAVANSLFKAISAMAFLPFISKLAETCEWLVPKKKGAIEMGPQYLEKHLLDTPPIALEQARREAVRMTGLACNSVGHAVKSFFEKDLKPLIQVPKLEQAVDNLQSAITGYLVELSQRDLTPDESAVLPVLMHSVNDIERIGDHAENIAELAERMVEKKLSLSDEAQGELRLMWNELNSMMIETEDALRSGDHHVARKALQREDILNKYQLDLKNAHVNRISRKMCDLQSGVVFTDFVDNLEKIGDHLTNIIQGVLGEMRWQGGAESEDEELVSEAEQIS